VWGSADLTRLTVLKKWFAVSNHLSSFAIFIADQASRRKTKKTTKEVVELFLEARTRLADVDIFAPRIPRVAATKLHACLRAFQNEPVNQSGGRCASFVIKICSPWNVGFIYIWGMVLRQPMATGSPQTTVNTVIHATETASMVPAAAGFER